MMSSAKRLRSALAATVAVGVLAWTAGDVLAQGLGTDRVQVDLSVIDDNGMAPASAAVSPSVRAGGRLLMPGTKAPASTFDGAGLLKGSPSAPRLSTTARPSAPAAKPASSFTPPSRLAMPKEAPAPVPMPKAPAMTSTPSAPPAPPKMAARTAPPPAPKMPSAPTALTKPAPPPAAKTAPLAPPPPAAPEPKVSKAAPPPPPPPSMPKVSPPEPTPPQKVAKATPAPEPAKAAPPAGDETVRVAFASGASKLPSAARADLEALAKKLGDGGESRLQLMAYAGGDGLSPSKARRLSLSRALAVRSFLIEKGVRSSRIDVRALGDKTDVEPVNRVDVTLSAR